MSLSVLIAPLTAAAPALAVRAAVADMLQRAAVRLRPPQTRRPEADAPTPRLADVQRTLLAEALRDAAEWRRHAAACEARIAVLEGEVAQSAVVTTDLRARLVCLHGKLATAATTARYNSFAQALGGGTRDG